MIIYSLSRNHLDKRTESYLYRIHETSFIRRSCFQALRWKQKSDTPGTTTGPQTTVKCKEHKMRIEKCACGMDRK